MWNFEQVGLVFEGPTTLLKRQGKYLKGNVPMWVTPKLHGQGQVSRGRLRLGQLPQGGSETCPSSASPVMTGTGL